jgi:hypothetical protein
MGGKERKVIYEKANELVANVDGFVSESFGC